LVPTDSDSNICLKPPVPKEPQAIVINTPEIMTNSIIKFTQSNAHLHTVYIYTSNNQHIHISLHFYVE